MKFRIALALVLFGLVAAQMVRADVISFDNNPDAWKAAAGTFEAPSIAGTARSFVVNQVFPVNPIAEATDIANLHQRVCYQSFFEPVCAGLYYRGPASISDLTTGTFWILFETPITGALFAENGDTYAFTLYDLTLTAVGFAAQLPQNKGRGMDTSFSFGFISDTPFQILGIRQDGDFEFNTEPIFPDFVTATPEIPSGLLLATAALLLLCVRSRSVVA